MTDADFKMANVVDSRLSVTDSVVFGVKNTPENNTYTPYKALSSSSSSHQFNLQLPSLATIMNRNVQWEATIRLAVNLYNNTSNAINVYKLLGWGASANTVTQTTTPATNVNISTGPAPFPMHSLVSTQTATLNSSAVTLAVQDVHAAYMRFYDTPNVRRLNSMCPNMWDQYQKYSDAAAANNNVLAGYDVNSFNTDLKARGSWPFTLTTTGNVPIGPDDMLAAGTAGNYILSFNSIEPLIVSPFIGFNRPRFNAQGIYGLSVFQLTMTLGQPNRILRTSHPNVVPISTGIGSIPNGQVAIAIDYAPDNTFPLSQLWINYTTPKVSLVLPPRNVVPYQNVIRYITNVSETIANGGTEILSSQSMQLNAIPDIVCCYVRPALASQKANTADYVLPIKNVSITFNNQSGLLSSATQPMLYNMACETGYNGTWEEFSGYTTLSTGDQQGKKVPTSGSYLFLRFGEHIQINQSYLAPGVIGSFNFQINVTVENNTGAAIAGGYELVLLMVQPGIFVTSRGSSQAYTSILSAQNVLDAAKENHYDSGMCQRYIGGGLFDSLSTAVGHIKKVADKFAPVVRHIAEKSDHPDAQKGAEVLRKLGYGKMADAMDKEGAGISGGRHRDKRLM